MVKVSLQALLCSVLVVATSALCADAEDEDSPDMDFLEYLGLWEESDEDWLLLKDDVVAENDKRRDPVPEGEASTETEDES